MRWYLLFGFLAVLVLLPAFVTAHEGMMGDDDNQYNEHYMYPNQTMMNETYNETYNGTYMPANPWMRGHDENEHGREIAEKKREEMKEMLKERKEKIREYRERLKEREEHVKEMREKYKDRYEREKEMYERVKHRGLGDPEAFRYAKGFVVDGIGFAYAHIELLEAKIIAMNLSDNTTAELLSEIEQLKTNLEEWKATIKNSTTPEELRNNVKAFREEWELTRVKIQAIVSKVVALKFEEVIEKAENRSWIIEDKIAKLEELGLDTSEIREAYQDYLDGLSEAKVKIEEAIQHFDNAINATSYEEAKEEYKAGREYYHEAKEKFSDTMSELKDVFKEYARKMREMNEFRPVEENASANVTVTTTSPANETGTNSTT